MCTYIQIHMYRPYLYHLTCKMIKLINYYILLNLIILSSYMYMYLFQNLTAAERLTFEHAHLQNTLIAIGQLARLQPIMFATCYKQVVRDFVVKELLVNDRVIILVHSCTCTVHDLLSVGLFCCPALSYKACFFLLCA